MRQTLPWHVVERSILREKMWLKKALDFGPFSDKEEIFAKIISSDEMLRQLSIAIVSGKIAASEITGKSTNCLWTNDAEKWDLGMNEERHGGEWHRAMMNLVRTHFAERNFNVVSEPTLNWGRADLGIYKDGYQDLLVEIGTTSLSKVWINILTMPDVAFLFIPTTHKAIELRTNETARIS